MPHEEPSFLVAAFIYLAAAVVSVPIAKRLGLGSVLGYLIAGAIIGPHLLDLMGDPENVMHVSELGVVIMLFLIGLELAPELLWRMRGAILGLGGMQVLISGLALAAGAMAFGLDWRVALAVGFTLALSSTAIVLQSLREKGLDSTHPGRDAFAVLLFQDIAIIPMLALFPLLALAPVQAAEGTALAGLPSWAQPIAVFAAVGAIILAGRFLVRPLFRIIARTGMQELFTAAALGLVVGVALLMQSVGISPALGAFLAGVVLADSEFRHELETDIEPFRALLLGLFFISVGAGLNLSLVASQPLLIFAIVTGLIAVKAVVLFLVARAWKRPKADSLLIAFALAQGGEFAFVLFAFAQGAGIVPAAVIEPITAAVAISMALTPLLLIAGERLSSIAAKPADKRARPENFLLDRPQIIVAGFGRFGQVVHRLLTANGYKTSILEHNADQVELVRTFGNKANYGDASRIDLLRAAGAADARMLIVAIDDAAKTNEIVDTVKEHFPHLKVFARAYDRMHVYELMKRGADGYEREMFEGALRLGTKALHALGHRANQAERAAGLFRRHDKRQLLEMAQHYVSDDDFEAYRAAVNARTGMIQEALQRDLAAHGIATPENAWDTGSLDEETKKRA